MRTLQLAAIALLCTGAIAAGFTIWQLVDATAGGPDLDGRAPVLIGDAPPPVAATNPPALTLTVEPPAATDKSTDGSETPVPRNLAPAPSPDTTTEPVVDAPAAEPGPQATEESPSSDNSAPPPDNPPTSVRIPRMGIEAQVIPVGLNDRGEMASPESFFQVGWWQHGPVPGDTGRAVLAGHIDSPDGEAIFYGIDRLAPGDEIFVASPNGGGEEQRFVVSGAALYHVDHAPLDQIFGPSTERELILITCGGAFDHDAGVYLYRQVVFATLAQ